MLLLVNLISTNMTNIGKSVKLGVFTLAIMNVTAVVSLRGLPAEAEYGVSSAFYYLFAALVFLIPTALVAAELAAMFQEKSRIPCHLVTMDRKYHLVSYRTNLWSCRHCIYRHGSYRGHVIGLQPFLHISSRIIHLLASNIHLIERFRLGRESRQNRRFGRYNHSRRTFSHFGNCISTNGR